MVRRAASSILACLLGSAGGCDRGPNEGLSTWTGDVEVRTLYGPVKGRILEEETMVWKGIPYAEPPEGDLRWKASRDPEPWETPLNAYDFGPECTQYDLTGQVRGSEELPVPQHLAAQVGLGRPASLLLDPWGRQAGRPPRMSATTGPTSRPQPT